MFGYLLSGEVFAQAEEEIEALKEIPFPVPYITNFDVYGNLEIGFTARVKDRIDLKQMVDAGLLEIILINDSLELPIVGTPD